MANKISDAELNRRLYHDYSTGQRATWAKEVVKDRAFYNGIQISQEVQDALDADDKFNVPVNETTPAITQVVGFLTDNDPRFTATARENSDVKVASDVADLLSYIWYNSDGNAHMSRGATDFEVDGMGALMAYLDPYADWGKGEIKLCSVNPLDIYIDPNSKDPTASDAAHIIISYVMTKDQISIAYPNFNFDGAEKVGGSEYPTHDLAENQGEILTIDETNDDKYRLIDRYSKVKVQRYHVYDPNSQFESVFDENEYLDWTQEPAVIVTKIGGKTQYIARKIDVVEMSNLAQQTGGVYHLVINPMTQEQEIKNGVEIGLSNEIPQTTTRLDIVTMGQLVEEGAVVVNLPKIDRIKRVFTIGNKEIYNEIMPISDYPIKTFMLYHNRNPFPQGDVRLVRPLQDQLNKVTELIITYNTNISNVKAFLPKGSGLKKELQKEGGKAGAQYFEYDPDLGGVPVFVQLTQMSSSLYQQRIEIIQQIQRIVGAYPFQDGNTQYAPDTKGGTLLMDEFSLRRINFKRKTIERALTQLAKVIAEMIPFAYTERKVIRLIKPNHGSKEIIFNDPIETERGKIEIFNDLTTAKFDVQMVAGSMATSSRWAKFDILKDLYVNGIMRDPTPILEYADLPNVDEILERESRLKQYEQQLMQAEEQIKKLQGDNQTLSRESVNDRKRVEVMKVATELKGIANKAEATALVEKEKSKQKNVKPNK